MTILRLTFLLTVIFIQNAIADTLTLNDGTQLHGTYAGGSRTRIRFEVKDKIRSILIDDVKTLTFERKQAIDRPEIPSAKRPNRSTLETTTLQPVRTGKPTLSVAKGTPLPVHLTRAISNDKNRRNDRFTTHLTKAITRGTRILLPKNTQLHGRIVRSQSITKGKAILALELTTAQINNHIYSLISNCVTLECDGDLLTITSNESAFDSEISLGDFILKSGDIQLPENTPITFELTSPLSLPEQ